jgi:hypothetical protein
MPRDGALILSDLRQPTPAIVCEPCSRGGRYVAKLLEQHGDAKRTLAFVSNSFGLPPIARPQPARQSARRGQGHQIASAACGSVRRGSTP